MEAPNSPMGVGSGEGIPLSSLQWGVGSGAPKKFLDFILEMLNFYAFWTLEHGDCTATVITLLRVTS